MTRIDFYFNVLDKQALLNSITQAALLKRRKVTIYAASQAAANQISAGLWQAEEASFLPNTLASNVLAAHTPILLHVENDALLQDELLVNMSQSQPSFFSRFTQLVELVGTDEQDKLAARGRYKFYRDRGYEIKNIDNTKV